VHETDVNPPPWIDAIFCSVQVVPLNTNARRLVVGGASPGLRFPTATQNEADVQETDVSDAFSSGVTTESRIVGWLQAPFWYVYTAELGAALGAESQKFATAAQNPDDVQETEASCGVCVGSTSGVALQP
jgi:hypothetical protein